MKITKFLGAIAIALSSLSLSSPVNATDFSPAGWWLAGPDCVYTTHVTVSEFGLGFSEPLDSLGDPLRDSTYDVVMEAASGSGDWSTEDFQDFPTGWEDPYNSLTNISGSGPVGIEQHVACQGHVTSSGSTISTATDEQTVVLKKNFYWHVGPGQWDTLLEQWALAPSDTPLSEIDVAAVWTTTTGDTTPTSTEALNHSSHGAGVWHNTGNSHTKSTGNIRSGNAVYYDEGTHSGYYHTSGAIIVGGSGDTYYSEGVYRAKYEVEMTAIAQVDDLTYGVSTHTASPQPWPENYGPEPGIQFRVNNPAPFATNYNSVNWTEQARGEEEH